MAHIDLNNYTTLEAYCEAVTARNLADYGRVIEHDTVEYYNEAGVFTIEDALKWELYGTISDVSKDANGVRARFDWRSMTLDQLQEELDYYYKESLETQEREAKWEEESTTEWKAHLRHLVSIGAKNIPTALKWDMSAEDSEDDAGYYCYHKGISYSQERLINRLLRVA